MTTTTSTAALTGRTRIPTLYPAKACHYCGTSPTAVGHQTPTGWVSVCETCAASCKAQVLGLVGRIDALATAVPAAADTLAAAVTDHVSALVTEALTFPGDASQAARTVVPTLVAILALGTSLAPVAAVVVPNKYPGKCADCGTTVAAEAGRRERADVGGWTVRHLSGACPTPAPAAPATVVAPVAPLAASEARRCITNRRDGKCLSCGKKVAAGAGYALQWLPDVPMGRSNSMSDGWATMHADCADSLAADRSGVLAAARAFGARIIAATGSDTTDHAVRLCVPFTTAEGDGNQPHVFLRIRWGALSGVGTGVDVMAGAPGQAVAHPMGARRAALVLANLATLTDAALVDAQAAYGRLMQSCGRCGADLTDFDSRAAGFGPECAKRMRR
jgi:hypothetical protein